MGLSNDKIMNVENMGHVVSLEGSALRQNASNTRRPVLYETVGNPGCEACDYVPIFTMSKSF